MHRIDEEVRRREELLEQVRLMPVAVPSEADSEGEDVEEDREPQGTLRGVQTDAVPGRLGGECGRRHAF
jgi:hypothetical protein